MKTNDETIRSNDVTWTQDLNQFKNEEKIALSKKAVKGTTKEECDEEEDGKFATNAGCKK